MTEDATNVRVKETIQSPKWKARATPLRTTSKTSRLSNRAISEKPPVTIRYGARSAHVNASLYVAMTRGEDSLQTMSTDANETETIAVPMARYALEFSLTGVILPANA
jgi:hypothetical protein